MNNPVVLIVIAQMFGTSLWFSTNGVLKQIEGIWSLSVSDLGNLTNSVQFGFIIGTLLFTITGFADKFKPSRIVMLCCFLGATFNAFIIFGEIPFSFVIFSRLVVGIALAGIYPIGMKLIISWDPQKAPNTLGLLVGMLVLGSSLPYLIRALGISFDWQYTVILTSGLCYIAGITIYLIGDGPHLITNKKSSFRLLDQFSELLKNKNYLASAVGYFGHMWELYAFWTCVPILISISISQHQIHDQEFLVSLLSFLIIGLGFVSCVLGGILAKSLNSSRIASLSLAFSLSICVIYPLAGNLYFFIDLGLLIVWGFFVISDSPQFSAISARVCPQHLVGTALTTQNCIGFSISMITIFLTTSFYESLGLYFVWILLPGPVLGLIFFCRQFGFLKLKTI
ncbi:MAG: MFS transporter [Paracoccaceae bacterium]